jgi:PPM family protein phosphatase
MSEFTVQGIRFDVAGFSEQGPRPENQDALSVDAFADGQLLAVADGMGGEKSGRIAADKALEALQRCAPIRSIDHARRAVREANELVTRTSESNPGLYGGMGCALAFLSLVNNGDGPGWIAAHVGDVRILSRSPDGLLRLETRDHTPAFARWEAGEISLDEIPDTSGANRLQRAVGRGGEPDVTWLPVAPGWSWLILSDGVYKSTRLDELSSAMATSAVEAGSEAIRRKVQERGPEDNFTAIFVRALDGSAASASIPAAAEATSDTVAPPFNRSGRTPGGLIAGAAGPGAFATGTSFSRHSTSRNEATVSAPRRSAMGGFAAAIAGIALVLAAVALWMARSTGLEAVRRAELEGLRMEVDSLRAMVDQLRVSADSVAAGVPPDSAARRTPNTPPAR